MSRICIVCCNLCGRDLYDSMLPVDPDISVVNHIDYYTVKTQNGTEEYCPKCYEVMWGNKGWKEVE